MPVKYTNKSGTHPPGKQQTEITISRLVKDHYFWYIVILSVFTAIFTYANQIFTSIGIASHEGWELNYYIALQRLLFFVTLAIAAWRYGVKAGLYICGILGTVILVPVISKIGAPGSGLQIAVIILGMVFSRLIGRQGEMKNTLEKTTSQLRKQAAVLNQEIAERKRVEEVLRENEKRYRLLAENATDVIWTVNINTPEQLTYISPSVTCLLGYSVEEAMAKRMEEIFTPDSYETAMKTLAEAITSENNKNGDLSKSRTLEINLNHRDGTTVPVEVNCSFVYSLGGEPSEILVIARDISERKQMQEQLIMTDRLATIGELVSGIAHEINNPLTSIIGFSQLAKEENSNIEELELIHSEAQRAAGIVTNLLSFARKHVPVKQLSQVNNIVQDVLKLRAYEQRINNIQVVLHAASDLPEISVDYFQMQQVFLNIIVNAESAMLEAHKKGILTIITERINNYIRISFADDGPGIPKENLNRIFTPFFTTKEVGKGTGLGLSICHGIVSEHGGKISARKSFDKGAIFTVELPVSTGE